MLWSAPASRPSLRQQQAPAAPGGLADLWKLLWAAARQSGTPGGASPAWVQDRWRFAIWLGVLGWSLQGLFEFGLYIPALAWPAFTFLGWLLGSSSPASGGWERRTKSFAAILFDLRRAAGYGERQ